MGPRSDHARRGNQAFIPELPGKCRQGMIGGSAFHLAEQDAALGLRGRLRFHDLLRTYAAECAERDESPAKRQSAMRHMIEYYVATATLADFHIMPCRDGVVRTDHVVPLADLPEDRMTAVKPGGLRHG